MHYQFFLDSFEYQKRKKYLRRIFAIFLLINFLHLTIPYSINNQVARQLLSNMPAEEEHGHSHGVDIKENAFKFLSNLKNNDLHKDIFYLQNKVRYAHYFHPTSIVDWLETFSPPPEFV